MLGAYATALPAPRAIATLHVFVPARDTTDQTEVFCPAKRVHHLFDAIEESCTLLTVERDREIVEQGAPATYCFQLVSGCARIVKLLADGRRQVVGFLLADDIFGWDSVNCHDFALESVTNATLRRFPVSAIDDRADRDRHFARHLRHAMSEQSCVGRAHMVLLGRMTATERIASFLLDMAGRLSADHSAVMELPMCRTDMADYLGLTVETISRGLAALRRRGAIVVDRTRFAILDRQALCCTDAEQLH
jgi:CRP-like cAMP-binding protein